MGEHRLHAGDGHEVRPPLVQQRVDPEERLQAPAEARPGLADPLGNRAHPPAMRGIQVQDPVRLPVAQRPQDDRLGLQGTGHVSPLRDAILSEVMSRVKMYTTEPCGFCRTAKALLAARRIPYEEINLAKNPEGRAKLVEVTGMMTFPQVIIDGKPIG